MGKGNFFDFLNQKRTQNGAHNKTVPAPDSTGLSGRVRWFVNPPDAFAPSFAAPLVLVT